MPRSTLTRAKICGWVLGRGAALCQAFSAGVTDPFAYLECGSDLTSNWNETGWKVEAQVGAWFRRQLSLNGRAEVYAVYIFPLILYWLSVLTLPRDHRVALEQSLSKLLWKGRSSLASREVCCQRPREGGLGMPDLESHRLA